MDPCHTHIHICTCVYTQMYNHVHDMYISLYIDIYICVLVKRERQRVTDIDVQHSAVKKQISSVAEQHDLRSSDGSIEAAKDMFCIASEIQLCQQLDSAVYQQASCRVGS